MSTSAVKRIQPRIQERNGGTTQIGTIERVDEHGAVFVDYVDPDGNHHGPVQATIVLPPAAAGRPNWSRGDAVALLMEGGSGLQPMILGLVADRLAPSPATPVVPASPVVAAKGSATDVRLDGRRVILDAQSEVVLRCGNGSITLTADGRIVIKGTEIVSRSSGANKIKGAVVNVN
jgi:hypothetical protein